MNPDTYFLQLQPLLSQNEKKRQVIFKQFNVLDYSEVQTEGFIKWEVEYYMPKDNSGFGF